MARAQSYATADAQPCSMPSAVPSRNPAQHCQQHHSSKTLVLLQCSNRHYSSRVHSNLPVTATAYTVAILLLLAVLSAPHVEARPKSINRAAQPCIECSQCLTTSCQRICSPSCRGGRSGGIVMNGDQCKVMGEEAADSIADDACRTIQGMCQAGSRSALAFQSSGSAVSSSECAAIANGACQRAATSSQNTPCGVYLYFGFRSCSGRQFSDMYRSRVMGLCRTVTNRF